MAGSFDTVRASLVALVQEIDQKARELPLYVLPETPQPPEETPTTQEPAGETMGEPNGGNSGNGGVEDLFSTTIAPVPGEGPVSLPADETPNVETVETVETVEPSKPAAPVAPVAPVEPEKPEKPEKPAEPASRDRGLPPNA